MASSTFLLRNVFILIGIWTSCVQSTNTSVEEMENGDNMLRSRLCAEPLWNPLIDLTESEQNISDMLLKVMSNPASVYCGIALITPDLVGNVSGLSSNGHMTGASAGAMNSSGLQNDVHDGYEGNGQPDDPNLTTEMTLDGVSAACRRQMALAVHGMTSGQPWARQLLDAIAKPESGISAGHTTWLGSFEECVRVKAVTQGNSTSPEQPVYRFKGRYCSVKVALPLTRLSEEIPSLNRLVFGLCVPNSCGDDDISGLLQAVADDEHFKPAVSCKLDTLPLDTESIIIICILSVLGFLMLCGTLHDVMVMRRDVTVAMRDTTTNSTPGVTNDAFTSEKAPVNNEDVDNEEVGPSMIDMHIRLKEQQVVETTPSQETLPEASVTPVVITETVDNTPPPTGKETAASETRTRSTFESALLAFSVYTNAMKVFNTRQSAGSLQSINGIRVLSMGWIILAHTFVFLSAASDNVWVYEARKRQEHWTAMVLSYGSVSVDSFFALSGLLVAYLTLREMKRVGGIRRFNWLMYYFHRFWRLTPPYMLLIMTYVGVLRYVSNGPLWDQSADRAALSNCRKNWWTNLFYINNIVRVNEPCLGWSWYLANDMQFYVLSPLLLIPLFHHAIGGMLVCLLFLATATITPGIISKVNEFSAQTYERSAHLADEDFDYRTAIYYPPYCRMGPYIIGMVTGYVLYRTDCQCRIPKMLNLAGWLLTGGILTSAVYGLYGVDGQHVLNEDESSFYHALARSGWGVAVSWVVFSCSTGHGGVINRWLTWKAFVPLGKLTYCTYLIHPVVILIYYESRKKLIFITDYDDAYLFIGHVVTSYGAAFFMSLAFESPMIGLEKVVFRRNRSN